VVALALYNAVPNASEFTYLRLRIFASEKKLPNVVFNMSYI
jgi:hypothetical protein